ncbi:MAG: hypothetical protein K5930_04365 [Treponemataceae bacterium]|nr:hypothetical protein [Treponemataceae bacterium]
MKILILSCNTGGGHNSAAKAIKETFDEKGHSCDIMDALSFGGQKASDLVCDAYIEMVKKAPRLFGEIYKMGNKLGQLNQENITPVHSPIYYVNKLYANALEDYIKRNNYDAVICVHIFPAEAMTSLKKHHRLDIPFYFVATDYYCPPMLEETLPSAIFSAHKDSEFSYLAHGIDRKLLVPTGIPVSKRFLVKNDKAQARRLLGLEEEDEIFLLMSGSMGYGDLLNTSRYIFENGNEHTKIVAITGHNEELYKEFETSFKGEERLVLLGFTDKVADYLDACDVLLTKPGGLSSTEALAKGVTIIHTTPIPGCETENVQFFTEHHLSVCASQASDAGRLAIAVMRDKFLQKQILEAQDNYRCQNSAGQIADYVLAGSE